MLMNLGTLSTMARYRPPNLVHLIFDNESLLSVGGFPTATSTGTDLVQVAQASGVESVTSATTVDEIVVAFKSAVQKQALSVLVAKVEALGPASFAMDLGLLENRFQFQRYIKKLSTQ